MMIRALFTGSLIALGTHVGLAQETTKQATENSSAEELVRDPNYEPTPGDEIVLTTTGEATGMYVSHDIFAHNEFMKFAKAKDEDGLNDLLKKRRVVLLPKGTKLRVIEAKVDLDRAPLKVLEVRILDGPAKGEKAYVSEAFAAKMIPRSSLPQPKKQNESRPRTKPKAKPTPSPDAKANVALNAARNLEKSKKLLAAVKAYKQIVKDYPDTPQAKTAAERLKALEAK